MMTQTRRQSAVSILLWLLGVAVATIVLAIFMGSCSAFDLPVDAQVQAAQAEREIAVADARAEVARVAVEAASAEADLAVEVMSELGPEASASEVDAATERILAAQARQADAARELQVAEAAQAAAVRVRDAALADGARAAAEPALDMLGALVPGAKALGGALLGALPLQVLFRRPRQQIVRAAQSAAAVFSTGPKALLASARQLGSAYGLTTSQSDAAAMLVASWERAQRGSADERAAWLARLADYESLIPQQPTHKLNDV